MLNDPQWSQKFLSKQDLIEIEDKIKSLETNTQSEIVLVISNDLFGINRQEYWIKLIIGLFFISYISLIGVGGSVGGSLFVLLLLMIWSYFDYEKNKNNEARLQKLFNDLDLKTKNDNSVLVSIDVKSKKINLLVDKGINDFLNKDELTNMIEKYEKTIADHKNHTIAIVNLLENLGDVCSKIFPPKENNENELPNKVIFKG